MRRLAGLIFPAVVLSGCGLMSHSDQPVPIATYDQTPGLVMQAAVLGPFHWSEGVSTSEVERRGTEKL